MAALRSFARANIRTRLAVPRTSQVPAIRRTMASTPDSSHVSEHKVEAPHSAASHEAHQAHHDDHYDPPVCEKISMFRLRKSLRILDIRW
jgi:hypothetical protein